MASKPTKYYELDAGFTVFQIKEVTSLKDDDNSYLLGVTDFDNHTISIRKNLSPKVYREVITHEVFHVLLEIAGIGVCDTQDVVTMSMNAKTNEFLTTRLSRAFMLLNRLNPELFADMTIVTGKHLYLLSLKVREIPQG